MHYIKLSTIAVIASLSGCVTAPQSHNFESQRQVSISKDLAWSNVMEWLTKNRMQIKTVEKDSGIIYAERVYVYDTSYADCGSSYGVAIKPSEGQFNIFVKDVTNHSSSITVNADFVAQLRNPVTNRPELRRCNSKGLIEKTILDAVGGASSRSQRGRY